MNYYYKFPAIRGYQSNNEYYVSMIPLGLLDKLFTFQEEFVLPEFRAQRLVNESRIPEIKKYILDNRNSYVFSALSASIDGDFDFKPLEKSEEVGILEVDMNSRFLINDGQHRKAAILEAIKEDESLKRETISVVFFKDKGLIRSQQMFTDLNKHAVKTSNSLATLYDSRDSIAVATREVINSIPFLNKYTDKEKDILGKNSSKLFTLTTIYKSNLRILHTQKCSDSDKEFLFRYWSNIVNNITEWNELINHEITKKDLKENYIVTLAITIASFGKLGRFLYDNKKINLEKTLLELKNIDWSRSSNNWIDNTIRKDGKVLVGEEAVSKTYKKIRELLRI